jgi:hypothetical protein
MKAILGEVSQHGLRLLPADVDPRSLLAAHAAGPHARPTTLLWALLADADAEDLRAEVHAGRHREACGLLLNRAVELLSLGAAAGTTTRRPR